MTIPETDVTSCKEMLRPLSHTGLTRLLGQAGTGYGDEVIRLKKEKLRTKDERFLLLNAEASKP